MQGHSEMTRCDTQAGGRFPLKARGIAEYLVCRHQQLRRDEIASLFQIRIVGTVAFAFDLKFQKEMTNFVGKAE